MGNHEFYHLLAQKYEELFPQSGEQADYLDRQIRDVQRRNSHRRIRLIDAGCATGEVCRSLVGPGRKIAGFDPDPEMIRIAREQAEKEGLPLDFLCSGLEDMQQQYPPQSSEIVLILGNVLPHLTHSEQRISALRNIRQTLVSGGLALFQVLNYRQILDRKPHQLPVIETDQWIFHRQYDYTDLESEGLIKFHIELENRRTPWSDGATLLLYPLTQAQIKEELFLSGFGRMEVTKGFHGSEESGFLMISAIAP